MRKLTNILVAIFGTIWAVIILAVIFSPNPPKAPPESASVVSNPARDLRIRKAGEMIKMFEEIKERVIKQCKRESLAHSDCEDKFRVAELRILTSLNTIVEDEVQFAKAVDLLDQYERKQLLLLRKLETTRLPHEF
jgi:hypothetical protein